MIRFPRMHIATSVVNRILNAADELETAADRRNPPATAAFRREPPVPAVPDPTIEGAELDAALRQPPGDMPPLERDPASPTANAIEPVLHGGTSLDGLLDTISGQ